MLELMASGGYSPARLYKGKEVYIGYSVIHPVTARRIPFKERVARKTGTAEGRAWIKARIKELNAALALGWNPLRAGGIKYAGKSLAEACADFLKAKRREKRRPETMRTYDSNVSILLRWLSGSSKDVVAGRSSRKLDPNLSVTGFTEEHARVYMQEAYVTRELSPKSFNNIHTFYVTLWNWFKEEGYVNDNVFMTVKKKELNPEGGNFRPPTKSEREIIKADLLEHNPRFLAMCLLCFHAGIRPKEAYMLKPKDFNLKEQALVVPAEVAKNKRTMGVAIPNVLMPYLQTLDMDRQHPDHYVFSTKCEPGPKLRNSRDSGRLWDQMRRRTGLAKDVTMYQLKHAGGEQLSRDGLGEVDLMNHYRHHDLSETSTYTRRRYRDGVRTVIDKASEF